MFMRVLLGASGTRGGNKKPCKEAVQLLYKVNLHIITVTIWDMAFCDLFIVLEGGKGRGKLPSEYLVQKDTCK